MPTHRLLRLRAVGAGLDGDSRYREPVVPVAITSRRLGHKAIVNSQLKDTARTISLAVLLY